jgi:hypothetical protein
VPAAGQTGAVSDPHPFADLARADLLLDQVYAGGSKGTAADDPISALIGGVGNQGGFRYVGSPARGTVRLCVLYTSGVETDWPDHLDPTTGDFAYFGDNRRPGASLLETHRKGNLLLQNTFALTHEGVAGRAQVPPYLLFSKDGRGRNVRFRGLLAPGSPRLTPEEELVAVWRTTEGNRFQNYRAHFTVLDVSEVRRDWLDELVAGVTTGPAAPAAWLEWVEARSYRSLRAPRSVTVRSRAAQLPSTELGRAVLAAVFDHFSPRPHAFENFAADIWLMSDDRVTSVDVTRPSRDGGRDAVGLYSLGPASDPITIDFALEAKCYSQTNSVGVRELSRLISRLRARQFGVLVTTSFVAQQAYDEVREDGHPIVLISGADIVDILSKAGHRTVSEVRQYLSIHHRWDGSPPAAGVDLVVPSAPVSLDEPLPGLVPLPTGTQIG